MFKHDTLKLDIVKASSQKHLRMQDNLHFLRDPKTYQGLVGAIANGGGGCINISKGIDRIKELGFPPYDFIKNMLDSCFTNYFPYYFVDQVIFAYLIKGIKSFIRVFALFFQFYAEELKSATGAFSLQELIERKNSNMTVADNTELMNMYHKIKLDDHINLLFDEAILNQLASIPLERESHTAIFYIYDHQPAFIGESRIVNNFEQIKQLWAHIPPLFKARNLEVLFASWKDGRSIKYMISKSEPKENDPKLLLIQDSRGQVFGAYLPFALEPPTDGSLKFSGTDETFVFNLKPAGLYFKPTKLNSNYFRYDRKTIQIGLCNSGNAIYIDEDMNAGQTDECNTFMNKPLTTVDKLTKDFKIQYLELFGLTC